MDTGTGSRPVDETSVVVPVAALTWQHPRSLVRIASEDGRYAVSGILEAVQHCADAPSMLRVRVSADNVIDLVYEPATGVELVMRTGPDDPASGAR